MRTTYPLFQSHLDLAKQYWKTLLKQGDLVIDATCGNGKDSLFLAQLVLPTGTLFCLDIQEQALVITNTVLKSCFSNFQNIHLLHQSHEKLPSVLAKAIIYNLGYLPGGDKEITTSTKSTLKSLEKALEITSPGGFISITCYPGHEEGKKEQDQIIEFCKTLDPKIWNCCFHHFLNRNYSPSLLLLQKGFT